MALGHPVPVWGVRGASPRHTKKPKKPTRTQQLLAEHPLCEVCKNPAKERCHLVSQMELRRLRAKGHNVAKWWRDPRNIAALCKMCHDALDMRLGITEWYIRQVSGMRAWNILSEHFDRHLFGFQKLMHRRNLVLIELPEAM